MRRRMPFSEMGLVLGFLWIGLRFGLLSCLRKSRLAICGYFRHRAIKFVDTKFGIYTNRHRKLSLCPKGKRSRLLVDNLDLEGGTSAKGKKTQDS